MGLLEGCPPGAASLRAMRYVKGFPVTPAGQTVPVRGRRRTREREAPCPELFREVQAFTNAALILFFAELGGLFPVLLHCGPLEPPELGLPARSRHHGHQGGLFSAPPYNALLISRTKMSKLVLPPPLVSPMTTLTLTWVPLPPPKIPSSANI